ncbi:hypothetical protein AMELA_G00029870 [Ameiurus melas]|uniref:3-beta hydroxysteroid dehydrogenase/isomerase domain-containing protein n=1 Tax=Ameiurus melas TaxID=219545 RepID=A0A7J6BEF3_AMEME|nr:hypothetical protein AMELA_G00029870 [Ameiurus melas]
MQEDDMSGENPGLVYLLTGGCGFLGQHLLKVLLEEEEKVKEIRLFDKHIDSSLEDCSTGETGTGLEVLAARERHRYLLYLFNNLPLWKPGWGVGL